MIKRTLSAMLVASCLFVNQSAKAEDRFSNMVSPVSNPVNFEDPRSRTELRPIYLYHKLDNKFVTQGGSVQIYALQARYAIDDRLSVIANKDGYVVLKPDAVLNDDEGFGNIAAGVKYAFYKDNDSGVIASGGLTYEIPLGDNDVLQGEGDGTIRPFLSAGWAGEDVNVLAATGFRMRMDGDDSSFYDLDFHVDVPLCDFYPGFEMNLVHVLANGHRLGIPDEGADYFNFGASASDGETIITGAAVARYRVTDSIDYGIAYQFPISQGPGNRVFDWRITTDLIFSF